MRVLICRQKFSLARLEWLGSILVHVIQRRRDHRYLMHGNANLWKVQPYTRCFVIFYLTYLWENLIHRSSSLYSSFWQHYFGITGVSTSTLAVINSYFKSHHHSLIRIRWSGQATQIASTNTLERLTLEHTCTPRRIRRRWVHQNAPKVKTQPAWATKWLPPTLPTKVPHPAKIGEEESRKGQYATDVHWRNWRCVRG